MDRINALVYLFFNQKDLASSRKIRDKVRDICSARGWRFKPCPVETSRDAKGRPVALVAVDVASGLYPLCHRSRVATLSLSKDPRVPLHPRSNDVLTYNRHIPLRRFVAHKCCWYRLPNDTLNDTWAGVFATWCNRIDCENERDPRCLPFHLFNGQGRNLSTPSERSQFNEKYGVSDRNDDSQTNWKLNPSIFHGQESLTLAGCALPAGTHWDVIPGSKRQIYAPKGAWEVEGHFNAYPDAHIRKGRGKLRKLA